MLAIPISRDHMASHFTKAKTIALYDSHGAISQFDNPAIDPNAKSGCAAKKAMLNLIKRQGAKAIIVQNIGERMLGKLLSAGIAVYQGDYRQGIDQLRAQFAAGQLPLMDISQARVSLNHAKKGGCGGGCGCSGHDKAPSLLTAPEMAPESLRFNHFKSIN
ncbi:NifB/NifX family molybdenum-iron cluster-binding protein [Shewanella sp. NIFS-20-20]|uniref:NifB/NifX family molybdenum-iron cluster-binding protein n=1 Tax=Shewanella sp. NIFS-20-20 TaxID=2853806 RepID=UPI001C494BBD|nr:NifB/NifX family molybdenum-iron cluster-binding protein [Shewanella sp. NIFS-20-20]MBV7314706.1 dinitrogenase iron-molybdenum cofactor biosynthesis protein [Shewanella sp. NIFS-20-20]